MQDARLTGSRLANQSDVLARLHLERDSMENGPLFGVPEPNRIQTDRRLADLRGGWSFRAGRVRMQCEGAEDALGARHGSLNRLPFLSQRCYRLEEALDQDEKC